jgi:hypothetical protein
MPASETVTQDARAVARRFLDAFNARDREALRALVTEDAEFRRPRDEVLRGPEGAGKLLAAAEDLDLRLVPFRDATVDEQDGRIRVAMPVRELIGPDDIERVAEFEIRDGHIAAFAMQPME